jgi:hypothetical protein
VKYLLSLGLLGGRFGAKSIPWQFSSSLKQTSAAKWTHTCVLLILGSPMIIVSPFCASYGQSSNAENQFVESSLSFLMRRDKAPSIIGIVANPDAVLLHQASK